jgi:hypothetical protein
MKTYAVTFLNKDNWKVLVDCFNGNSESDARHDFKECYRHGNYQILGVVELPERK